jgi:hypothetical protein
MSADHEEEEEQFHSGEEDDEIVLGARRSKASDDEDSIDDGDLGNGEHSGKVDSGVPQSGDNDDDDSGATAAPHREPLDVNLPDDLEDGEISPPVIEPQVRRPPPRPKLEPYQVPTSGAFYMHDDRFDEGFEPEKPKYAHSTAFHFLFIAPYLQAFFQETLQEGCVERQRSLEARQV